MDVATMLRLAQSAVDVGNVAAACEFYEAALAREPHNGDVMEAYAETLIHGAGDVTRARQLLRHAIDVSPRDGYIKYVNLAQLCEADEALQLYTTAYDVARRTLARCRKRRARAALQDTLASVCCATAELYLTDLCDRDDAERRCEQLLATALRHCAQSIEAHQLLASLRISQQRPAEALTSLRRAVALTHTLSEDHQPTYEAKVELGRLLMQVHPGEAFAFLREVLQLGDNNPYVWFLLGECARMRGRYADAARLLRRARVMLVVSDGDADALREVDGAIALLVREMGGEAALAHVGDLDALDPLALLQPESDESDAEKDDNDNDDEEQQTQRGDVARRQHAAHDAVGNKRRNDEATRHDADDEDDVLDEPTWEPYGDDDDDDGDDEDKGEQCEEAV